MGWEANGVNRPTLPTITASTAASHNFATNPDTGGPDPNLRCIPRRNKANSTQPATPADAVNPATPQRGSIPIQSGSGFWQMYPRTVVSATRSTANFNG